MVIGNVLLVVYILVRRQLCRDCWPTGFWQPEILFEWGFVVVKALRGFVLLSFIEWSFIIPTFVAAFKSEDMMEAQTGSLTFCFLTFMARCFHLKSTHSVTRNDRSLVPYKSYPSRYIIYMITTCERLCTSVRTMYVYVCVCCMGVLKMTVLSRAQVPLGINLGVNVRVVRVFANLRTDIDVVYTYRVAITFIFFVFGFFWILFTALKDILPMALFDDECAAQCSLLEALIPLS